MLTLRTEAGAIEWIEDAERFAALEESWDRLAEPHGLPFLRHAWFSAWWHAFGGGRQLRICAAWEGPELVGLFPLAQDGRCLEALANVHTPVFRPFARDEPALRVVIDAALAAGADELSVPALPVDDPAIRILGEASRRAGRLTLVQPERSSPFVATEGDFGDYLGGLSRKERRDLDRRRRKLEAEHRASFAPAAAPGDLERDVEQGFAVEASGWKGERGTAILNSPATLDFYRGLARGFAAAGDRLRLSTISVDGEVIAFDYTLLDGGRLWVLKGGYDERFRSYAPGILLTLAQIGRCFELGLETLELAGDEAGWKSKFATGVRRLCVVGSYRRRPQPLARYAYRRSLRPRLRWAYKRLVPGRDRG